MKQISDANTSYSVVEIDGENHAGADHSRDDNYGTIIFPFDNDQWEELQAFSQAHDSILFLTLLAAFRTLLFRYNYEEDVCLGNSVGNYSLLNKVLFHSETTGDVAFLDLLKQVKGIVVEHNRKDTEVAEKKYCRIMFTRQQMMEFSETGPVPIQIGNEDPAFAMIFSIADSATPYGIIHFHIDAFFPDIIQQMVLHYKQLLGSILRNPEQKIGLLPMLTDAELHTLTEEFNDTARPYYAKKTIAGLFEEQVLKTPGNVALFADETSMTYRELNEKSNQLARHLISQGVKNEDNVGLLANRGFDMIVGLYAILKAGAAYVPVEPCYPVERQQYMLTKSSVKFVVSNVATTLNDLGITVVDMATVPYGKYSVENPDVSISSTQLAYTIYTSGSTGVPKGVMIEHHSAVNLISWVNNEFNITAKDRLLFITSFCFDLSVYDIFGMLSAGGSIVIANKEDVLKISKLADMLQRFQITFWDSVPTTMDYLVGRLAASYPDYRQASLRLVFLSGDWIPVALPEKIKTFFPGAYTISLGGATEGTVWSNYYPIKKVNHHWHSIPYGKPITNNAFYILNEHLQPVPAGVRGELYIGGVGVARGYANDKEKTAAAFLNDPFTEKWGGKMYRTGDLGRMLQDGNMEFLGRKDTQVKVRGHRVELSEIESLIKEYETVNNAIVLYHEAKMQLAGYVVPGEGYDRESIIAHLRKKLPDYMVPARWVEMDSMPLTSNGKTDVKALREIDIRENMKTGFIAPCTELEQSMATMWTHVLGAAKIGTTDNFFDIGGQSLLAVELITDMEKKMGISLPLNILYKYPTISQLCSYLNDNSLIKKWKSLVPIKPSGYKMPLYIVHGDGLSISNFHNLAMHININQPVFSLQPQGLHGAEKPLESIAEIARHYVSEILEQNPSGPYALAGYSFGGYVALEMKRQLEEMSKKVKMVAILDTNAENMIYKNNKGWVHNLPKKIKRQVPKFLFIVKSMFKRPVATIKYQHIFFKEKFNSICYKMGLRQKPSLQGVNVNIDKVNQTHLKAFRDFHLAPFNDKIYLFKAKTRMYYVDDNKYLGWTNYAQAGVNLYEVPGDHKTMFSPPNVSELAHMLQHALDNC